MPPLPFVAAAADRGAASGGGGPSRAAVPFRQAQDVRDACERKRLTAEGPAGSLAVQLASLRLDGRIPRERHALTHALDGVGQVRWADVIEAVRLVQLPLPF
jgi:hypothetical protein